MRAISLIAFALLVSVVHSRRGPRNAGRVTIQTLDSTKLQATFSHKTSFNFASAETVEMGVHIESEVNENIERVKIQKLNGEEIVSYHHLPNQKATLLNVMGQRFVSIQNEHGHPKRSEYRVPHLFSQGIERIFSQGKFNSKYIPFFDSHGANASRVAAFQEMLHGQEIPLMRAAVEAIGNRGIIGRDNPPVLPVMMMVMRFSSLREAQLAKEQWWPFTSILKTINDYANPYSYIVTEPSDCKIKPDDDLIRCSTDPAVSNGACCKSQSLCPTGKKDHCNGMCGYGCDCWKWACGDCCIREGCLGHDECCRNGGMTAWGCALPTGFKCDEPYTC